MPDPTARLRTALADQYRIERELGVGSMATVYLAEDLKHHRKVAVKVLRSDLAATLGAERFLREIEIAAQLQHPHILMLIDSGEVDGFLYYVMPFVDGVSVRDKLSAGTEIPMSEVLEILCDLTEALAYAHQQGVVHRDVKPDNILVSRGNAVVTDFGLAKAVSEATGPQNMTRAGIALGTPPYMAPEQATADPNTDHRADIYAVGCVAYELLTGKPPFVGPNAQVILAAHMTETPEPVTARRVGVPTALANIVMKCLEKKPEDRFQSTDELLIQLRALRSSSGAILATDAMPAISSSGFWARRKVVATTTAVAIAIVALAAWFVTGFGDESAGGDDDGIRSLAVLPFADLSPERDQEYLGDGIAETLIGTLSRLEGLRVAARTSAFSFKGRNEDVRTIGKQLGVSAVLEGTVQRSGNRIRITAQLIDAEDGFHIWSQTYDRDMDDVFAVQDEVTQSVVRALQVELMGDTAESVETHATENVEAYSAYLLGRFHWNQRTGPAIDSAATYFARALEMDSSYGKAWSGLAETYVLFPQYLPGVLPTDEALDRAERAARRAIALDQTIAAPHATLGALYQQKREFGRARQAYEQAVTVEPGYATGHQWYATYLIIMGETAEAVAHMRHAATLDPLSQIIAVWLATALDADGQPAAAGEQYERTLRLNPDAWRIHRDAWMHHLRLSNFEQSGTHLVRMFEIAGEPTTTAAQWQQRVVDPATRAAALPKIVDSVLPALSAASPVVVLWGLVPMKAEVLGLLGDTDRALDLLEQAYGDPQSDEEVLPLLTFVLNPALRDHPRFTALLRNVGVR